jgi:hypothetical protein
MVSKIIIENRTDLSDDFILEKIIYVIRLGRISNNDKQYCYLSTFNYNNDEYCIATDLNKKSDKFTVYKDN